MKIHFLKRIIWSITKKEFYYDIIQESLGKSFKYLILLTLFISLPYSVLGGIQSTYVIDDMITTIRSDEFPHFSLKNGQLDIRDNEPRVYKSDDALIVIVDKTDAYTLNDLAGYSIGYLITPDQVILSQAGTKPLSIRYDTLLKNMMIDNESLVRTLGKIKPYILIFITLIIFVGSLLLTLFSSLILSIVTYLLNTLYQIHLSYSQSYRVGNYSLTLPLILIQICNFTAFIPHIISFMLFFIVSGLYMFWSMHYLKKQKFPV